MRVTLLSHSPNPDRIIATAMRQSHSSSPVIDINAYKVQHLIETAFKSGHYSVFEHAHFTFNVSGISRVCSHQFVRHRMLSFVQQSERYSLAEDFIIPEGLKGYTSEYYSLAHKAFKLYKDMVKNGVRKEDARFILPQAVTTHLTVSGNARAWLHFLKMRMDKSAQWEIRKVAWGIYYELQNVAPITFDYNFKNYWEG
jgi:thymidylate synthase (FAD)